MSKFSDRFSLGTRRLIYGVLALAAVAILSFFLMYPFPARLRVSALLVTGLGVLSLVIAKWLGETLWGHLLRDIGIAFIVAVVVTMVFEYNTRSIEERETMLSIIDKAMVEFVPPNVWDEVKGEILQRQRIRRNVNIDIKILRSAQLSTGKQITAPPGQVILWMRYGYDLYGMAAGGSVVPVQHELGYEMWNKELEIPRFERVSVSQQGHQVKMYEGEELKRIYNGKGSIHLDGPDIIHLPGPSVNQPVRIVTERYELMNAPGSYNLVMPELTARSNESREPTIKITISEVPWDLDTELDTYYAPHAFTQPDKTKNVWVYDQIMLPGQSLTLLVTPKSATIAQPSLKTQ